MVTWFTRGQREGLQILDPWRRAEPTHPEHAGPVLEPLYVPEPLDILLGARVHVHHADVGQLLPRARI